MVLRDQFAQYQTEFEKYAAEGYRVLIAANYPGVLTEDNSALKENVQVLGYILLSNPIRKEAKSTFQYFNQQGVDIKVISGDNPVTVARVAKQAGINGADKYIDAQTIKDGEYEQAVQNYNVFGRVKPDQKRKFVVALQNQGNTVAMTGDGVNDILAMKKADCSIAMASGNSAAVQASQVVLLDSNFAKMPLVVNQGRQVVNNIQRSASLFLVKNIFILDGHLLFDYDNQLSAAASPDHIDLCIYNWLAVVFIGLRKQSQANSWKVYAKCFSSGNSRGLTDWLAVAILVIAGASISLDHGQVGTTATMLLVLVGFMVMYHISAPINKFRLAVMGLSVICIIGSTIFFPRLFSLTMLNNKSLFILAVLFCAAVTIFRWLSKILDGIAEVLVVFDQKGKNMTFVEFKEAYDRGKNNVK